MSTFHCHTCGQTHSAYTQAERHADTHGGGIIWWTPRAQRGEP